MFFHDENMIICIINNVKKIQIFFLDRTRSFIHLNDLYILNEFYGEQHITHNHHTPNLLGV